MVYHKDGGSIVNYCEKYGVEFDSFQDLLGGIRNAIHNYSELKERVLCYTEDNSIVTEEYIKIIEAI